MALGVLESVVKYKISPMIRLGNIREETLHIKILLYFLKCTFKKSYLGQTATLYLKFFSKPINGKRQTAKI